MDESNFFEWECYISGPEGTPFEGGIFPATLTFPKVGIPSPFLHMSRLVLCYTFSGLS